MNKKIIIHFAVWSTLLTLIHLSPISIDHTPKSQPLDFSKMEDHEKYLSLKPAPLKVRSKYKSTAQSIPDPVFDGQPSSMTFDLKELSNELKGVQLKFQINRFADGYALLDPLIRSQTKDLKIGSIWVSLNNEPIVSTTWAGISREIPGGSEVKLIKTNAPLVISSTEAAQKGDSITVHFGDIQ